MRLGRSARPGLLDFPTVPAGYSRRRLVEKLDMKPGTRAHLRGAPSGYLDLLGPLPEGVVVRSTLRTPVDFIQAFFDSERRLARDLPALRDALIPGGALWISWPKKASGVATDITEDVVRRLALANRTGRRQGVRGRRDLVGSQAHVSPRRSRTDGAMKSAISRAWCAA